MADNSLLEKVLGLQEKYAALQEQLSDPEVISDMKKFVQLNKEYKELTPIIEAGNEFKRILENYEMAKGILAGAASGLVYKLISSKNSYVAMLCAAIVCPVVNTGVFLLGMAIFFMDVLQVWANGSDIVGYLLTGIVLVNFVPELIINVVFSPAGNRIIKSIKSV